MSDDQDRADSIEAAHSLIMAEHRLADLIKKIDPGGGPLIQTYGRFIHAFGTWMEMTNAQIQLKNEQIAALADEVARLRAELGA